MSVRKTIIKLFKLYNISDEALKDYVKRATDRQQKLDEKYWKERINEEIDSIQREHDLELHEKNTEISMLENKLQQFRKVKTEIEKKSYNNKKQARDNLSIAIRMASKTEDVALALLNTLGEIKGIKDEAENNKILIESK